MPPTTLSAFHPSPKRKRDQPPPIPLLNTALRPAPAPSSTTPRGSPTPDSPRNAVADQLRGMTLTSISAIPMSPLTPTDDVVRKKPKLEAMRVDSGTSLDEDVVKAQLRALDDRDVKDPIAGNTPKSGSPLGTLQARTQQPRIFSDIVSFAQPTVFASSSSSISMQQSSSAGQRSRSKNRSSASQPRQRKKSPSPPLSALTWQDNEITGHLVDPSIDPEDDGTGLNGIGFKPTPALAYARAQKRRQQVLEWKAREAREARAKRTERRRRGIGSTASRDSTVEREVPAMDAGGARRTVKFAI
ncbi:hypothetical protein BU26DRAFT_517133 [Trematosphaeria pertusa]|uniref:BZIP domain-containing protein n=1 Tax=Trematosphaeria pertusa TaxID=390896 RepID=A0A6A6IQG5_9PLEO|nr:uncharacterized protein BU26DRAFT_517133 [Trematosphaeria pertusa]KAF2252529.1 hypothetical protein BU26DRAFT_517133 [Trematosphaeria pertusa]